MKLIDKMSQTLAHQAHATRVKVEKDTQSSTRVNAFNGLEDEVTPSRVDVTVEKKPEKGNYQLKVERNFGILGDGTEVFVKDITFPDNIHPDDEEKELQRIVDQVRIGQRLNHLHHMTLLGYDKINSREHRLIYTKAPGRDLSEIVSERSLRTEEVLNITEQIASALEYLHDEFTPSIKHGDLSPRNVRYDEESGLVKLVDHGSAVDTVCDDSSHTTRAMTPGFAGPEVGIGRIFTQSDVYGLGALMIYMITKKDPADFYDFSRGQINYEELKPLIEQATTNKELVQLIEDLTASYYKDRPSACEVVSKIRRLKGLEEEDLEYLTQNPCLVEEKNELLIKDSIKMIKGGVGTLAMAGGLALVGASVHWGFYAPAAVMGIWGSILSSIGGVSLIEGRQYQKEGYTWRNEVADNLDDKVKEAEVEEKVKPRGLIGRNFDNALGRDTPHRRYFNAKKEIEKSVRLAPKDYDFDQNLEQLTQLAHEAGYELEDSYLGILKETYQSKLKERLEKEKWDLEEERKKSMLLSPAYEKDTQSEFGDYSIKVRVRHSDIDHNYHLRGEVYFSKKGSNEFDVTIHAIGFDNQLYHHRMLTKKLISTLKARGFEVNQKKITEMMEVALTPYVNQAKNICLYEKRAEPLGKHIPECKLR